MGEEGEGRSSCRWDENVWALAKGRTCVWWFPNSRAFRIDAETASADDRVGGAVLGGGLAG